MYRIARVRLMSQYTCIWHAGWLLLTGGPPHLKERASRSTAKKKPSYLNWHTAPVLFTPPLSYECGAPTRSINPLTATSKPNSVPSVGVIRKCLGRSENSGVIRILLVHVHSPLVRADLGRVWRPDGEPTIGAERDATSKAVAVVTRSRQGNAVRLCPECSPEDLRVVQRARADDGH